MRWQHHHRACGGLLSDGSVFFELGNEIISAQGNGTFENDSNMALLWSFGKLRTDHFEPQ